MSKFIGRRVAVGLGNESTRGTGVSPSFWIPHTNLNFFERTQFARSNAAINKIADSEQKDTIESWTEGDIEGEIRDESFGLILKALAGADPSSAGSDPTTHTYTLQNDNQHGSLSIAIQDPIGDLLFEHAMLNSLEITQELDQFAMFTAGFMAKKPVASSFTPSFSAEDKFTKQHLTIKLASDLASLSGASDLKAVESLTLSINKNVNRDSVQGTAEPVDFLNFAFSVEGELVLKYEDRTYRNYMLDDTNRAMELKWTNGSNAILTIQLPKVDFINWEPDYTLDEVVRQTVPFKANYDLSGGNDIISTLTLANDTSSY